MKSFNNWLKNRDLNEHFPARSASLSQWLDWLYADLYELKEQLLNAVAFPSGNEPFGQLKITPEEFFNKLHDTLATFNMKNFADPKELEEMELALRPIKAQLSDFHNKTGDHVLAGRRNSTSFEARKTKFVGKIDEYLSRIKQTRRQLGIKD